MERGRLEYQTKKNQFAYNLNFEFFFNQLKLKNTMNNKSIELMLEVILEQIYILIYQKAIILKPVQVTTYF
jgi:hypothetical protein